MTESVLNTKLYSFRHQATTNAKYSNVDDVIIAATFGHILTKTEKNIMEKKSGWKSMKVKVDQDTIEPLLKILKRKQNSDSVNTNVKFLNINLF